MSVRVEKYGGSSLATTERIYKVAAHAIAEARTNQVVLVVSAMGHETDRLRSVARDICKGKPPKPELDQILATGEIVSSAFVSMAIQSLGGDAVSLLGNQIGLETDSRHGDARIKGIRGVDRIHEPLCKGKIVVVAGYQGVAEGGEDIAALTLIHPIAQEALARARAVRSLKNARVNIEMFSSDGSLMLAVKLSSLRRAASAIAKEFGMLD